LNVESGEGVFDVGEEVFAAVFEEVEDVFEAFGAAVVGVGYFGVRVIGAELAEEADFLFVESLGIEGAKVMEVLMVHDEGKIEGLQVGGMDLTGAAGERGVAVGGGGGHALVGEFAGVPTGGAGGVDEDLVGEMGIGDEFEHDAFRGGRAADVAEADEEEAEGSGHVGEMGYQLHPSPRVGTRESMPGLMSFWPPLEMCWKRAPREAERWGVMCQVRPV
jgi:hypothetical protein